jgi:KDO2-lipid IV(A) lauroyltransferase
MSSPRAAAVLYRLAWLAGALPVVVRRGLAALLARLWRWTGAREAEVTRVNLALAFPEYSAAARRALQGRVLAATAWQALDTLAVWTRPRAVNLARIREHHGAAHYHAALAAGRGVIVAAPHFGQWELLNQWLAAQAPISILYRAPDSALGEAFLRRVRANAGAGVVQVRAEGPAVRQLWKSLAGGAAVGILPDQQPKRGDGEFAPFFGVQALTMTLLPRLAARSGAPVLLAWCERIGNGADYALHIEPLPAAVGGADVAAAVTALNAAIEAVARRDPAQYQWTYKRYTLRPPDNGETNPYRAIEHRRRRHAARASATPVDDHPSSQDTPS